MSSESSAAPSELVCVIKPERSGLMPDFRELWRYRELFGVLAMRDVQVRYKQTWLGYAWAVIVPTANVLVFGLLFGVAGVTGHMAPSGVPYFLTSFCGSLVWLLFASGVGAASGSVLNASGMIKKVYFPRLVVPGAAIVCSLVDFVIMAVLLVFLIAGFSVWGGYASDPSWRLLCLPLFAVAAVLLALGCGIWLAALSAMWRDTKFVIPFLLQLGQYASPVFYEAGIVPRQLTEQSKTIVWLRAHGAGEPFIRWCIETADLRAIYGLNPMAGIIEGVRWSVFGGDRVPFPGTMLVASVVVIAVVLVSGLWYFRRTERKFIDIL